MIRWSCFLWLALSVSCDGSDDQPGAGEEHSGGDGGETSASGGASGKTGGAGGTRGGSGPIAGGTNGEAGEGGETSNGGDSAGGAGAAGTGGSAGVGGEGPVGGGANGGAGGEDGVSQPDTADEVIDAVRNGGSVDVNGDGTIDITVRVDGKARIISIPDEAHPLLVVTRDGNGSADKRGDFNLDGKTDFAEVETESTTALTRTTERDLDFDGHFEKRELLELDLVASTYHLVADERAAGAVTWVNVADVTGSATAAAGSGDCNGLEGYPPEGVTNDVAVVGTLRIATSNPRTPVTGGCSAAQSARIEDALRALFRNTLDELAPLEDFHDAGAIRCLSKRQPDFLESLVHVVSNGHGARIACGGSCAGTVGATQTGTPRVNLNFAEIGPTARALQGTLLHELIHASGYPFGPEQREDHGHTVRDSIYACERWCTGASLSPDQVVDIQDCFRCSGTYAAKQECCGDLTVCIGGCCNGPCLPDGTCSDACSVAKSNGFSCGYEGTTQLDATVDGFGWVYTSQLRWRVADLVTNYQAGKSPLIKRGIRYKPTGTVRAALPALESLNCVPAPSEVALTAANYVGDFIIGLDPPGLYASGSVTIPGGTALVCDEGGAPAQGTGWGWLLILPVGTLTRPDLTGSVIEPTSQTKSSWNLKAADPTNWQ